MPTETQLEVRPRRALDRREFLSLGIGALVVGALPLASFRRHHEIYRRTVPVMGTIAEIAVAHRDPFVARGAIDAAIAELRWADEHLSRFRADSEVGFINRLAGVEGVRVTEPTAEVVTAAVRWAELTGGAFDPSMARVSELWNIGHRTSPPPEAQTRQFAGRQLFRMIDMSSSGGSCRIGLCVTDAGLDLGGIAKGYAVDRAVGALRRLGVEHALVNAGGDLYALGDSPNGEPWKVGLRSPVDPTTIARTIEISDRAVATSGDYMQYFEFGNRRYHHLFDPRTGEPVERKSSSITVIASTCTDADAGATAAFALPPRTAATTIRRAAPGAELIAIG